MTSPEEIKKNSRYLRGTIQEELQSETAYFSDENATLMKFHGIYQQDDRDLRKERLKAKQEKAWMLMVRSKIPGGDLTAEQYLTHDRVADELGNGTLRITSRQGFQLHGVLKGNLKAVIAQINQSGIMTWGACGDVVRNVVATPAPLNTPAHQEVHRLAHALKDALAARTRAYSEIWLDGERLDSPSSEKETEPIYGETYLPRKFKIGIAIPPCNDIDIYTHDLGYVAHAPRGEVEGYTVLVGGGMGMSHGNQETYPALSKPLFYVRKEDAVAAAIAVVTTQRDYGNRENRKRARLKYLLEVKGLDWFRKEVLSRLDIPTWEPKEVRWESISDPLGWHEQGDDKWFCGVRVESGRIKDEGAIRFKSGFRAIVERFRCPMRLTANHNILFYDLYPEDRLEFDRMLQEYGIPTPETYTAARRISMACVALPTCGLALGESERVFPGVMDEIDAILRELGLQESPLLFRMTGCPNGCVRPYNADFAFVGRAPGKYALFVGGANTGDRLAGLEQKSIALEDIPGKVREYLVEYVSERQNGESFSEYWGRSHQNGAPPHPEQFHVETAERNPRQSNVEE